MTKIKIFLFIFGACLVSIVFFIFGKRQESLKWLEKMNIAWLKLYEKRNEKDKKDMEYDLELQKNKEKINEKNVTDKLNDFF